MRVVKDRAASGAELLPAGQALINTCPLIFAFCLPYNAGYTAHFPAVNASEAVRPAHLFKVIEALIVGVEVLGNIYHLHSPPSFSVLIWRKTATRMLPTMSRPNHILATGEDRISTMISIGSVRMNA